MKSFNELRSQIAEQGQPTGIKLYHTDKEGKESHTVVFTPRDAQQREKEVKKAGGKTTHRAVMYGKKEGEKVAVKEETDLAEIEEGVIQRSGTDKVTEGSVPAERNRPAISAKDKGTLGKIADLMAKEKAKKDLPFTPDKPHAPVAKAGKYGSGYSTARHLARQGMKDVQKEEVELEESTQQSHKVSVTVSDPHHTMVTMRKEKINKRVVVNATDKGEALAKAKSFYEKRGYKVHDVEHHSVVPKTTMKTEEVDLDEAGAPGPAHVYDSNTEKRHSTYDSYKKAVNAMKKLNADEKTSKYEVRSAKLDEEQINELKKSTLGSYIKKASSQAVTAGIVGTSMGAGHKPEKNKPEPGSKQYAVMRKREAGVRTAVDKLTKEETEMSQMDKYLAAISGNADFRSALEEKKLTPAEMKKREEIAQAIERENPGMEMGKKMAIATATAKRVAEETELDEGETRRGMLGEPEFVKKPGPNKYSGSNVQPPSGLKHKVGDKVSGTLTINRQEKKVSGTVVGITKHHTHVQPTPNSSMTWKVEHNKIVKEETEGMHYCAKHVYSEEFGEGVVVEGSHAEPDANGLIEWYDVDFGGKVERVMTEKVKVMHAEYHMNHKKKVEEEEGDTPDNAKEKSLAKLAKPYNKVTHADVLAGRGVKKEGVELKTFSQLMAELDEAKKDDYWDFKDLKDEPKSGTRKIAGTRYGGSAQKDEPEEDDEDDNNKPAVKRGRGRPAGSKSGARH